MLQVKNIDVYHGDLQTLWGVSLNVNEKEIVSIIGSNGAGKSTLLYTISGLLRPNKGEIELYGQKIHNIESHQIVELGISLVPEGRQLFPNMTVLENLEMGAYTKKSKIKRKENLEKIFELFPRLQERTKQFAGSLSGGEQQMLAIARGLMSMPKILMLDEPSLGLSPDLVKKTFESIKVINEEGITILLVEQNVHLAISTSNRTYVLEDGRITIHGKGDELLNNEHVKKAYLGL